MKNLLSLQELDLKIEACRLRELEIPKQKGKFDVQKKRLAAELDERDKALKALQLEQRDCEKDIEAKQGQIAKYKNQLNSVKKNEEYQALLHEIDMLEKQIGTKEERILILLDEVDAAKARLAEDKKRIDAEQKRIDAQCAEIDAELAEAVKSRQALEARRDPIITEIDPVLYGRYNRIRISKKTGAAIVPMKGTTCGGCQMTVTPQAVNEILAGKVHACPHCGRMLYHAENFVETTAG
ncbi:MAG TPA: C4-type zinc ribbon domain-containing protein [Candidatus Hydrogenedentes bacterium]|nr:C4-type zinc ribbon domain-containing protein [Candidatus Hydrogenedentota bacterium]